MNYFSFILKSSNQHGVHSPYVYNFLTKGLYTADKDLRHFKKHTRFLLKTIKYFQPQILYISNKITDKTEIESILYSKSGIPHLWIMTYDELLSKVKNNFQSQICNDDLIVLDLRQSKKISETLLFCDFTIVMHFYYFAIISKRKEQQKELFFLRY